MFFRGGRQPFTDVVQSRAEGDCPRLLVPLRIMLHFLHPRAIGSKSTVFFFLRRHVLVYIYDAMYFARLVAATQRSAETERR